MTTTTKHQWTPFFASVMLMSLGFFGVFSAYLTTEALETTVLDRDLATLSLSVLYACFSVASVAAPKVVDRLGPRISMVVGAVPYALLVWSNTVPGYWTTVPAFVLVGVSASLLWTGQGVYLGRCALRHAHTTGEKEEEVTSRFNGIFFAIFQFNGFLGTVLASSIQLSVGPEDFARANKILFLVLGVICAAGVVVLFFLKSAPPLSGGTTATAPTAPPSPSPPPVSAAILVDNHPASAASSSPSLVESKDGPHSAEFASLEEEPSQGGMHGGAAAESATESHVAPLVAPRELTVTSMLRFMATSAPMAGLCPISVYNGLALGFFLSDFPDVYASKLAPERNLLGHDMVGYVTAVYFLVAAIASYAFTKVVPRIGRYGSVVVACATHAFFLVVVLLCLAVGLPDPQSAGAFVLTFLLSASFAVGEGALESQLPAVLQSPSYFPEEQDRDAAMSVLRMTQSIGFAVQFGLAFLVDNLAVKAVIVLVVLLASFALVVVVHRRVRPLDA